LEHLPCILIKKESQLSNKEIIYFISDSKSFLKKSFRATTGPDGKTPSTAISTTDGIENIVQPPNNSINPPSTNTL